VINFHEKEEEEPVLKIAPFTSQDEADFFTDRLMTIIDERYSASIEKVNTRFKF
jgi:hypothetical protein